MLNERSRVQTRLSTVVIELSCRRNPDIKKKFFNFFNFL